MSTALPNQASSAAPIERAAAPPAEIRVFGHTNLFYWWPVWLIGFIMAALTYMDGHMMAVVPEGTVVEKGKEIPGVSGPRDVLVAPAGQALPPQPKADAEQQPHLRVAASNNYGVIFVGTILLVAVVTNITVRGLASVVAIAAMIIVWLALAQLHLWDDLLRWFGGLDVRLNAGGYLAIAVPLLAIWLFAVFVYDHYTYLIVSRGQVRIRQAIGEGEIAVDTSALMLEKRRNDFFRHWLLGLGAGDLHVKTGGAGNLDIELANVLMIGTKIRKIEHMIREKEVTEEPPRR